MKNNIIISHNALNIIGFIAIVFILYILKPLIMPLLLAMILAVMVFPIQKIFEKKLRCSRLLATLSSIIIVLIITACLISIIYYQLYNISNSGEDYSKKITEIYHKTINYFESNLNISKRNSFTNKELKIENLVQGNFDKISNFISESGSIFSDLVLIPIYLFFFLYYRRFLRIFVYKLFSNKSKSFLNTIINKVYNVQKNYLIGLIKVITIVGVLNTIGLLILGIENAIFFGFFAALLLLIPYIGIVIGSLIPAVIALATKDSAWYAFGVIAVFGFIQFLEGNFITPKITGSKVNMNAFAAILSLIIFSMLWGVAGMIVALPIMASLKIVFDNTPSLNAYGFLIGEPVDCHLQTKARSRLKHWKKIRSKQE